MTPARAGIAINLAGRDDLALVEYQGAQSPQMLADERVPVHIFEQRRSASRIWAKKRSTQQGRKRECAKIFQTRLSKGSEFPIDAADAAKIVTWVHMRS
jgi:hypothetical protein